MAERIKEGREGGVMENSAGISFMGFTRMDLESAVCFLCAVVFSLFLMVFSWQDFHPGFP